MKNYKYILTHSSGNLTVDYNPTNWSNFNLLFKRSKRYHSVLRSEIIDSDFPRDGKAYIDNIYDIYGIGTDIGCEIQYLDKSDFTYKTLLDGIIDLVDWTKLRDTTGVKIADNSNLAKFAARDEIKVPINKVNDLDGNPVDVYTYLSTMNVEGVDIWQLGLFDDDTNAITSNGPNNANFTEWRGVSNAGFDINEIGSDATLPANTLGGASGPIYTNNSGGSIDVQFRIKTRIVGSIQITGVGSTYSWTLKAITGKNGATTAISLSGSGGAPTTDNFDTSYDSGELTATLANGETIEIYHEYVLTFATTGTSIRTINYEPIYIEVFEITPARAATDHDMPLLHELGAKILEITTGQSDPLNAPLIGRTDSEPRTYGSDGDYSLTGVASGNILRGFNFENKPLTTSFADFFKSLDALYNLGMYYDADNSEFVIGDKADFYKDLEIITLGEVKDLEVTVAQDEYFNSIKTGYVEKLEYDAINGNQNFNVPGDFANDGSRIQNTLDIQSAYHGDDYGIELSRQSPVSTTASEDTKHDDQIFIITGQRDGGDYQTLQGFDDFVAITGIYSPETRLNLNITMKRNMERNSNRLSVPLFVSKGSTSYMDKQFELDLMTNKSASPAGRVFEKNDIAFSRLDAPLYLPEIYDFTAPLTNADALQLLSDPHGYVEFDYLGETYKGFILQVSTEPFNRRGNWTLLRTNFEGVGWMKVGTTFIVT